MSFKDSMLRGLAMYGVNSMAQSGPSNNQMIADILNDVTKTAR
ncbi:MULTISPECIES: hypothetical protein [Bifidobacterium]|uniref:Uncharacterized protein n=1 Tax=Bifidobacterium olomucense TaxID=2675324 RepID=A0A7Y0EXH4_9BIFI|nr:MULTISPECIES: hypothetical protein [Bifidobacterium]NMM97873.1 hypothetical protein [Bifidobacterium sp. DSM 109959]